MTAVAFFRGSLEQAPALLDYRLPILYMRETNAALPFPRRSPVPTQSPYCAPPPRPIGRPPARVPKEPPHHAKPGLSYFRVTQYDARYAGLASKPRVRGR